LLRQQTLANWSKLSIAHFTKFCKMTFKVSNHCDGVLFVKANGTAEFIPYVFQLFAALLEANPSATLPDYYQNIIAPILMPLMWESRGNVPALVRLLSSIITRGADFILQNNQVEPVLGIFQKLVSTKANESYGFDLLETVLGNFPP